ncbi:MAG: PAS domain S-box protein, partial [Anaerolineae bacterium]|nr:PAS domain S-box protein [Anaerolineae bacterium]
MRDAAKTKTELIKELQTLRQRVAQLERKVSSGKKPTRPPNGGFNANGFRAIFNDSLDIMMFIDGENGNIFDVNPAIERILGYEPRKLADRHFSTLFPPDPNIPRDEFINQIRTDGIVIASQEFQKSDGSICPMDLTATIIPWEGQDTILATLRDVTERDETEKALRASEERFRQVISSIRDHIYVTEMSTDGHQIIRYISPNIAQLTGYSPKVFQQDWHFWFSQIIHPDDRKIAKKHLKQLAAGRQSETEYRLIKQNGQTIW